MLIPPFICLIGLYAVFGEDAVDADKNLADYFDMKDYGNTWMYFPDGDDTPRRISLRTISLDLLRQSFWMDGIQYRLYTRYNVDNYLLLDDYAIPMNDSSAWIVENLQKAPIILVTHGWESSADKNAVINIKNAYLESRNVNVIAVDWSDIAESILYPIVAQQTSKVGNSVGKFLDELGARYKISGSQIHLIGHSLGAHVMGNAGHATNLTINRITGLDPARPLFEMPNISTEYKLDPTDANFVDIIHTCSGILGVESPIGHADFYPNSGQAPQPGCSEWKNMMEACSHSRSHFLFADSIRHPDSYPAFSCANWNAFQRNECSFCKTYLGVNANRSCYGSFYLITNDRNPYGRGLTVS